MLNTILSTIETAEAENDRQFVVALARGLSILYTIRFYPHGVSYQQICEMTQLPKPTVSRLLRTLVVLRFLRQNPHTALYQADLRLLELTTGTGAVDPSEQVRPLLANFAANYHVSVSLAVAQYGEMLYVQSIRSPARLAVQLQVGSTVPMPDTAIGRAYYAALSQEQRKAIQLDLKRLFPTQFDEKLAILEQQEALYKEQGFTSSDKEFSPDITAIAVTVKHPLAPHGIYSLNTSVPVSRVSAEALIRDVAEPLKDLAVEIQSHFIES
ncbi:MAG: IclR family transcriptional regulator [Pelistega sp.]|nr:IclR family transcriptional regulator [Pelistega sp.]